MKKFISLVLALLMTVSAASLVGAAEEPAIAEGAVTTASSEAAVLEQYEEAIQFLYEYGIYHGKSATDLAAADPIERYQMALFVARLSTGWVDDDQWGIGSQYYVAAEWYDHDHDTSGFDDVIGTPAADYLGALSYASQKNIILGYGNRKFGPTDGITYQDALTMICRTLGYKDLKWPWGFIEKAVTLELTKGIPSSVKYTDKLNRGEVAQLIYNALFAKTYEGDTLAARNFNGKLGWETIIITVAGRGRYIADKTLTGKNLASDAGDDIGFNIVKEDGTLDATTYFVKNTDPASFNFGQHEERYLGYAYKALFTKDENSKYVNLISVKSLQHEDTIWNFGLPTKGEDGKYPITTYLAGKKLVPQFSKNTYLNTLGVELNGEWGIKEFILKSATEGSTVTVYAGRKYAIDWNTGNILEVVETKNADEKLPYIEYKENGVDYKFQYNVAWWYNSTLNQYFKFHISDKNGTISYVGLDILDPAEMQNLIENSERTAETTSWTGLSDATVKNTAYASLITFDLPGYEPTVPNYGLYEEYRFAQYKEYDEVPTIGGDKTACYVLESKDAVAEPMYQDVTGKTDFKSGKVAIAKSVGWISEDGLTPTDGDYVICSTDLGTGEIKVVKIIYKATSEKADKDNFVTTGVVRAYNTNDGVNTITIDGTQYSYNYSDLLGDPFIYTVYTDKTWGPIYRAAFTNYFKSLFNQYVTYVVIDGKLVWVEPANPSKEMIVVDSYAGLSSDGYIVVNGYNTKDLVYTQFRIGSYDGWVKGDYYYYLDDAKIEQSFKRGSLYRIISNDKDKDVYYVETVFHYFGISADTGTLNFEYWLDQLVKEKVVEKISLEIKNGYRTFDNTADEVVWEKTSSKDKYVLICNPIDNFYNGEARGLETGEGRTWNYGIGGGDYAPIVVYTGAGKPGWKLTGYRVKGTDAIVVIGVDYKDLGDGRGTYWWDADQWQISYVLFLHYDYETANYNGADSEGWYLLGASEFTARVFNFYNGNIEVKNAVNKNLIQGYTYPAIGEWIVNDAPYAYWSLDIAIPAAYQSEQWYDAWHYSFWDGMLGKYIDGTPIDKKAAFSDDGDTWKGELKKMFDTDTFSKKILSKLNKKLADAGQEVKGLTTGVKWFWVETDTNGKIKEVTRIERDAFRAWIKDNSVVLADLYFWVIQEKDGGTVCYIEKASNKLEPYTDTFDTPVLVKDIMSSKDAEDFADIKASATASGTKKNGIYLDGKFEDITFTWVGTPLKEGHHAIDLDDFHFGDLGDCTKTDWDVWFKDGDAGTWTKLYGALTPKGYAPHDEDGLADECDLIQSVTVKLPSAIELVMPTATNTKTFKTFYVKFTDTNLVTYTFKVVVKAEATVKDGEVTKITYSFVTGDDGAAFTEITDTPYVDLVMDYTENIKATLNGEWHIGDYPEWVDWYVDHDGIDGYGPYLGIYLPELKVLDQGETYALGSELFVMPFNWIYFKDAKWVSSDSDLVAVDEYGNLKASKTRIGIATITASIGDKTATCDVIVGKLEFSAHYTPNPIEVLWTDETKTITPTLTLTGTDKDLKPISSKDKGNEDLQAKIDKLLKGVKWDSSDVTKVEVEDGVFSAAVYGKNPANPSFYKGDVVITASLKVDGKPTMVDTTTIKEIRIAATTFYIPDWDASVSINGTDKKSFTIPTVASPANAYIVWEEVKDDSSDPDHLTITSSGDAQPKIEATSDAVANTVYTVKGTSSPKSGTLTFKVLVED